MKKTVYRLILFAAITAFVLSLSPSVKAEPNDTQTKQTQCIASDTKTLRNADNPEPVTSEQPAVSKENSQLQLAKEQLRGDFYKDSQDNLKWALGIIIGLVIIFVGYAVFKDTREYRQAVADAKQALSQAREASKEARDASDKARDWEGKAREKLAGIDEKVADKLEEIEVRGQELITSLIQESEKQRKASREEAEKERKISELWNEGLRVLKGEEFEAAANAFEQMASIKPDMHEAYNNWGIALTHWATKRKEGDEADKLFAQACKKYAKAVQIKPDKHETYDNWGNSLSNWAETKRGDETDKLFVQACEKYAKAVQIKPDKHEAYTNWGAAIANLAKKKTGKERNQVLGQAKEKCLKAESIKTGSGAYNLACVHAVLGEEKECEKWLKTGEKAGTLVNREEAMADADLKSVRDKDWFKKLRWKGE